MTADPKWQPRNAREAESMERNVARLTAQIPKKPMPEHVAAKFVAFSCPNGIADVLAHRKQVS